VAAMGCPLDGGLSGYNIESSGSWTIVGNVFGASHTPEVFKTPFVNGPSRHQ